ncbi:MAG: helix-turn-helix transcriptional regulator [Nitrospinales bacterium]
MNEILRAADVCRETRLSRTTLWRLERVGKFPARVQLGERAVGWRRADIEAWIESRPKVGEEVAK